METIFLISLKLIFTPNTLGCYGLLLNTFRIVHSGFDTHKSDLREGLRAAPLRSAATRLPPREIQVAGIKQKSCVNAQQIS